MSTTVTSVVGFGVKVDREAYERNNKYPLMYPEEQLLDPQTGEWSELCVEASGWAGGSEDYWVFIKEGLTRTYSGISGNGMSAPLRPQEHSPKMLQGIDALGELMKLHGITGKPCWHMVTWIN